jgi:hypothetical protein
VGRIDQVTERMRFWLRRKRDYDATFKTHGGEYSASGVAVLRDIGQFCGAYKSTVKQNTVGSIDPLAMAYAEGKRAVYLHMQRRLRLTDDQILNMMEEAHD